MKEPQLKKFSRWLVNINLIIPLLIGIAAAALVAVNYELPIIIEFLAGIGVFTLAFIISAILWKYTLGYLLAFGVGVWWAYKTRNDD